MHSDYGKHEFMHRNFRFFWNTHLEHLDVNVTFMTLKKVNYIYFLTDNFSYDFVKK